MERKKKKLMGKKLEFDSITKTTGRPLALVITRLRQISQSIPV